MFRSWWICGVVWLVFNSPLEYSLQVKIEPGFILIKRSTESFARSINCEMVLTEWFFSWSLIWQSCLDLELSKWLQYREINITSVNAVECEDYIRPMKWPNTEPTPTIYFIHMANLWLLKVFTLKLFNRLFYKLFMKTSSTFSVSFLFRARSIESAFININRQWM